ncbi:MAG: fibronectin type III domain-containing protein, partial [Thiotrichales bacterium]|nr:fibronectin type III domain-containing protein [Thiotrichales bacterium]
MPFDSAEAQTRLLVGNTSAGTSGNSGGLALVQAFTTGGESAGYSVASLQIGFNSAPSSTNLGNLTITLRNVGTSPPGGTVVGTFTNPATGSAGLNTFTAPAGGIDLAANTTYYIYLSETAFGASRVQLRTFGGTTLTDEDSGSLSDWSIANNSHYNFFGTWTSQINLLGFNLNGSVKTAGTTPTAPDAPTSLTATAGDAQVTLNWADPSNSDIDKYQFRQGTGSPLTWGSWTDIGSSSATTTTHTVTGLTNGTQYSFQIRAVDGTAEGTASSTVTATPRFDAPAGLTATAGDTQVTLAWTDPSDNAISGYEFRQGSSTTISSASWTAISGSGADTTSHTVTGLTNGTAYSFQVRAVNGAASGTVTATPVAPLAAPTGLVVVPGVGGAVLYWTDPGNPAITGWRYRVRASGTTYGWSNMMGAGADTTKHTVTGLGNSALDFQIQYFVGSRVSTESAWVSATTKATADATVQFARVNTASNEGESAAVGVTLSALVSDDVTVYFRAGSDTDGATKGDDYPAGTVTGPDGTTGRYRVTIPAGMTSATLSIPITDDSALEVSESFSLAIVDIVSAAVIGRGARVGASVTILDNDVGIVLSPTGALILEPTGTATYTVRLGVRPTATVTVAVASQNAAIATAAPAELTFTDTTWNTPQMVTVTAVDDDIDNPGNQRTVGIAHTPSANSDNITVNTFSVTVNDDDARGYTFTPTALTVDEGDSGSYTVALSSEPTANVPVTITSDNSDVTVDTNSVMAGNQNTLVFTADDWNTARTVTVSAARDSDRTGDSATLTHAGLGGDYGSISANTLAVTVNDAPAAPAGLTATAGDGEAALGWTDPSDSAIDSYQIRQGSGSPFEWGSWADIANSDADTTAHTVTGLDNGTEYSFQVRAVDGTAASAASNTATATPAAADTDAPTATLAGVPEKINSATAFTATVTFSEAVVGFIKNDIMVTGGTAGVFTGDDGDTEYTLVVTPAGSANVVVTVLADSATDGNGKTGPAAEVVETAVWDATAPTLGISGVPASINATTAFTATFTFSESVTGFDTDDIAVTGGSKGALSGSGATYTMPITPAGSADVVVTVRAAAATDGLNTGPASAEEATAAWEPPAAPTGLTATPGNARVFLNWTNPSDSDIDKYQVRQGTGTTVTWGEWTDIGSSTATTTIHTVTGLANGTEYSFQIRAVDGSAESVESNTAVATPAAALVFTPASLNVNEGMDRTYTVALASRPTGGVTVTVASDNTDVTVDTNSVMPGDQNTLSFTTTTWGTAQTVTVAAAQDVDTTNDTATLSHSASGGGYNSVTGDLAVTVTDDDSPSVTVAETGGGTAVTEGGGDEDTFTVV